MGERYKNLKMGIAGTAVMIGGLASSPLAGETAQPWMTNSDNGIHSNAIVRDEKLFTGLFPDTSNRRGRRHGFKDIVPTKHSTRH